MTLAQTSPPLSGSGGLGAAGRRVSANKGRLLLLFALTALVLWPLLELVISSLAGGGSAYGRMLEISGFSRILVTTLYLALGSVVIAVTVGTGLAWCVSRAPRRARGWIGLLPLLPLIVPGVANTTGWIFLLSPRVGYLNAWLRELPLFDHRADGPGDVFSIWGIIVLSGFSLVGFVYLYVRASMESLGAELREAAAVCGASGWRQFRTVTLPLIRPALVYSAGIAFLLGVGQFTNPLLLGRTDGVNVLTTAMYSVTAEYPVDYALGSALASPLLLAGVVVILIQRRALGDQSRYAVVTGKSNWREQEGTWWAALPVLFFAVIAALLPVGALVIVACSPFWSGTIDWAGLNLDNVREVLDQPRTRAAIETSVRAIAIALAIVLPLGFALAHSLKAPQGRLRSSLDWIVGIPLAMPAAIFGFAVLNSYAGEPLGLYGTTTIIAIAYVTLMVPHAVRPQLSAFVSVGKEYAEASKVCGASRLRTLWKIEMPLVRQGIAVAAAISVVLLSHEFAASMMVRSSRTEVMGTLLYGYYTTGLYPHVAVVALLMVAVTTVGVVIALAFGGSKALEN